MLGIVLYALFVYGNLESILYGYLIAWVISLVVSLLYVGRKFKVGKIKLNNEVIKSSLKSGVYLMGSSIFITIFVRFDQIMLWLYGFEKELGWYSWMYTITSIVSLFLGFFTIH